MPESVAAHRFLSYNCYYDRHEKEKEIFGQGWTELANPTKREQESAIFCFHFRWLLFIIAIAAGEAEYLYTVKGALLGKLFYIMGKSASGKDTLFRRLLADGGLRLREVILYTTRPMRAGEREGVAYHFLTAEELEAFRRQGKIIEERTYQTVLGPWTYATLDDGQIHLDRGNYLISGVLESYRSTCRYFGEEQVEPLYIEVEDGERLRRAWLREKAQAQPRYAEMCRRFLADEEDFSEEKLREAGIVRRYSNADLEACLAEIRRTIQQKGGQE